MRKTIDRLYFFVYLIHINKSFNTYLLLKARKCIRLQQFFIIVKGSNSLWIIVSFSQHLIPFARIIISFSRDLILFARIIISFSRNLILFARNLILFARIVDSFSQDLILFA